MATKSASECRIYVASLSDYNAGILHGVWIELPASEDEVWEAIRGMLATSPTTARYGDIAEEHAIHDSEGLGRIGENEGIADLVAWADLVDEHGIELCSAARDCTGGTGLDPEGVKACLEERYRGEFDSEEDYARQLVDDCYDLDKLMGSLANYFDYAAFARDLFIDGYSFHGGYVFSDS